MKSLTTPDFWHSYANLPTEVKERAKKIYSLWLNDQSHPSLHFKKVSPKVWSIRITDNYRALALKKGEDYFWIWIGSHDQYERIIN